MNKIKVIVVEPMKAPEVREIPAELSAYQEIVGGYIEAVYPFEEPVALVCNEEGKLNGMPLNRALSHDGKIYDIISGTFFIVRLGSEDFDSLTAKEVEKFTKLFETPEMFVRMKNGGIVAIPYVG